jgi:hypothetical protein
MLACRCLVPSGPQMEGDSLMVGSSLRVDAVAVLQVPGCISLGLHSVYYCVYLPVCQASDLCPH